MAVWREVKRMETESPMYVSFLALYRDERDMMCDSLSPQWERTSQCRVEFREPLRVASLVIFTNREQGNQLFKRIKAVAGNHDEFMELYECLKKENGGY